MANTNAKTLRFCLKVNEPLRGVVVVVVVVVVRVIVIGTYIAVLGVNQGS